MDLTNILEQTISGVLAFIISAIIVFVFQKIVLNKKSSGSQLNQSQNTIAVTFFKNPFLILVFVTSFIGVLTLFSFMFGWQAPLNFVYLFIATFILSLVTKAVYENQCPNCAGIFSKKLISKETLHEEKRPYVYRDLTIYQYSDGSEKEHRYSGVEKTKMETYRTEKEYYNCTSCSYKWDKIQEKNLDLENRPKPNIVRTKTDPPNILYQGRY